jgi:hypothetical protein
VTAGIPPPMYWPCLLVSPLRRVTFSLRAQRESNQRESAPGIRVSLRSTPLAPALFRGSSRWAIHGPSFLVWHPCQTPLSTAPPLGLLTGFGDRVVWAICGRQSERQEQNKDQSIAAMGRSYGFVVCRAGKTRHSFAFPPRSHRRHQTPHSAGRVESLRKGLSDMDAARAAMGQGWPFAACP